MVSSQIESKKRKRDLDDTVEDEYEESDSKTKCFLNRSAIQNSTQEIVKLQVTLGAGRIFSEEKNSTPLNKNLNNKMEAEQNEKEKLKKKSLVECSTCAHVMSYLRDYHLRLDIARGKSCLEF